MKPESGYCCGYQRESDYCFAFVKSYLQQKYVSGHPRPLQNGQPNTYFWWR
jgi:hypothetical protein